jgi:hypothetical protein
MASNDDDKVLPGVYADSASGLDERISRHGRPPVNAGCERLTCVSGTDSLRDPCLFLQSLPQPSCVRGFTWQVQFAKGRWWTHRQLHLVSSTLRSSCPFKSVLSFASSRLTDSTPCTPLSTRTVNTMFLNVDIRFMIYGFLDLQNP